MPNPNPTNPNPIIIDSDDNEGDQDIMELEYEDQGPQLQQQHTASGIGMFIPTCYRPIWFPTYYNYYQPIPTTSRPSTPMNIHARYKVQQTTNTRLATPNQPHPHQHPTRNFLPPSSPNLTATEREIEDKRNRTRNREIRHTALTILADRELLTVTALAANEV